MWSVSFGQYRDTLFYKLFVSGSRKILVYEIETVGSESRKAYFSTLGKFGELVSGDTVQISGLYGDKLGLKHGDPLLLKRIKSPLSSAKRVNVEPLSPDDWEILEQNSGRVENILLDQIRVIWPDQVFPLWIQRSICVFMKITSVEPMSYCLLLENNTEVLVSPKTRMYNPPKSLGLKGLPSTPPSSGYGFQVKSPPTQSQQQQQQQQQRPFTPSHQHSRSATPTMMKSSWFQEEQKSSSHENLDTLEPRPTLRSPSRSPRQSLKKSGNRQRGSFSEPFMERQPIVQGTRPTKPMLRRESSLMESVMKFVFSLVEKKEDAGDSHSESDTSSGIDFSSQDLPSRNGVLRVQPMKLSASVDDCPSVLSSSEKSGGGSGGSRKWYSQGNPTTSLDHIPLGKNSTPVLPYELFQPSTVYIDVDSTNIERELHPFLPRLPNNFIARLQRLPSPQEKQQKQVGAQGVMGPGTKKAKDNTQDKNVSNTNSASKMSSDDGSKNKSALTSKDDIVDLDPKPAEETVNEDIDASCYVRVVMIDRKAALTDEAWKDAADTLLTQQALMVGHVIVPDLLRRQLKLVATGSVWLQTGTIEIVIPKKVVVYVLTAMPYNIHNDMLEMAFRAYIKLCADSDHPLVVFQGMFVRYPVFANVKAEVQMTFYGENDLCKKTAVTMLSEVNIDSVLVCIERTFKSDKMGVVNKSLPYVKVMDFDRQPPTVKFKHLGGTDKVSKIGLAFLQACVGSRPLSRESFRPRRGLSHGCLLITGPRGSGKSSLAKALCRKMSQVPTMAHITLVDCKPLRGKTVAFIQKYLESCFDEAAWREPSIIVLDNLDVIVPASTGPEGDMNLEALYAAKVSQVLQGLIKYELENNSRVAVIATAASKNSIHSSLISYSGVHYFQVTLNIGSPNKETREKILSCILYQHGSVTNETIKTVDLQCVAARTEGYVARDLEAVVNRAIHYRLTCDREAHKGKVTLTQEDFEMAQESFKPVSIRGVALHKAGDLGWNDVGGLEEVKRALVETLRWPAKYPRLFAMCPLRLRSGILLYGSPGTGKTLLAGVVAKECGLNFISIKGPELLNKYIGASEQAVRDLFIRANSAKPCILFFDEFDSIAPKRGHDSTGVTDRVVNQLLTQLDGVEGLEGVYVLGATSRPDLIDPALLRPGRLDKCLQCSIPSENERNCILETLTRKMCIGYDVELSEIAAMCHHFTGADLKALLYNAQLKAIHENAKLEPILDETVLRIKGDDKSCHAIRQATPFIQEDVQTKLSQSRDKLHLEAKSSNNSEKERLERKASGASEDSATSSEPAFESQMGNIHVGDLGNNIPAEILSAQMVKDKLGQPEVKENLVRESRNVLSRAIIQSVGFDVIDGQWPDPDEKVDEDDDDGFRQQVVSPLSPAESDPSQSSDLSSDRSSSWVPFTSSPAHSDRRLSGDRIEITSPILPEPVEDDCDEACEAIKTIWQQKDVNKMDVPALTFDHTGDADNEGVEDFSEDEDTIIHKSIRMKGSSSMNLPDPAQTYPPHGRRRRNYERTQSIPTPLDTTDSSKDTLQAKPVTVFTSLERGLATLSPEDEARYLAMVMEIQRRDNRMFEMANNKRRTSLMVTKASNALVEVCQRHLLEAAQEMRPSVSKTERQKYDTIYNKFVASRTGQFGRDKVDGPPVQKRATLA